MYRNLSEAAKACAVALKVGGGPNFLIECLYILKMQGSKGFFDLKAGLGVVSGYLDTIYCAFESQIPCPQVISIRE